MPDFGPGDMRFRDFSKPWYNDRSMALCINAIESLLGKLPTDFFNPSNRKDLSRQCVEIGAKFGIVVSYSTNIQHIGIQLQKLIVALETKSLFTHNQLEDCYNLLLKQRLCK